MLPILERYLKRKGDPTTNDLRGALEVVKGELQTTRGRIEEFRARRADGILDGAPYAALDVIDGDIKRASIDRQRLKIARDLLRGMISEAEAKARAAECDQLLQRAVATKCYGLDLFAAYSVHAARLLEVLAELAEAEAAISEANRRLAERGDPRSVAGIETSYWTGREPGLVQLPEWSLLSQVRLPDPEVARKLAWPKGSQA